WSPTLSRKPRDRRLLALCAAVLAATLVGFFTEGLTGVPTWLVAFAGAALLLGIDATVGGGRPSAILRKGSWDGPAFVLGRFVVVLGLRHVGLTGRIGAVLSHLFARGAAAMTAGTSLIAAVSSSVMNNHPTAYMMGWAIRDLSAPPGPTRAMVFAALIGG